MLFESHETITEFQGRWRFLSNFWVYPFQIEGFTFNSAEHAFQTAKCEDPDEALAIYFAETPGIAKRLGRACKIREDWEDVKLDFMTRIVRAKFAVSAFREGLLATNDAYLQEGNRWGDTFWGVDLRTNRGQNQLGLILMQVREEIRAAL